MFKEHKALDKDLAEAKDDVSKWQKIAEQRSKTISYLMAEVEQLLKDKENLTTRLVVTNAAIAGALAKYAKGGTNV